MLQFIYKAILFDLGGVLFSDGTKQFIDYLHDSLGIDKAKASGILNGELGSKYREGKMTRNEFWQAFKQQLALETSEDELEEKWISGYYLNEGTKKLIRELSPQYGIYYLSDNVQERIDIIERKYHFLSLFKDGVFSHLVGVRKPNPKIYELALAKAQTEPEETVFIDDKASSLEPARQLGMAIILFRDAEQVRHELDKLGVLQPSKYPRDPE